MTLYVDRKPSNSERRHFGCSICDIMNVEPCSYTTNAPAAQPEDDAPAESHALVSFREVSTAVDVGVVPLTGLAVVCHQARCHNKWQQGFPRLPETE